MTTPNRPMTPAQAAQQSNRDAAGRYAEQHRVEGDFTLPTSTDSMSHVDVLAVEVPSSVRESLRAMLGFTPHDSELDWEADARMCLENRDLVGAVPGWDAYSYAMLSRPYVTTRGPLHPDDGEDLGDLEFFDESGFSDLDDNPYRVADAQRQARELLQSFVAAGDTPPF